MELTPNALANALGSTATGVKNQLVNLFAPSAVASGDYSAQAAEYARQQKMADLLSQMGEQDIPVSTAGGITAPISPWAALAKGLESGAGAYMGARAARDQAALAATDRANAQDLYKQAMGSPASQSTTTLAPTSRPYTIDIPMPDIGGGAGPTTTAVGDMPVPGKLSTVVTPAVAPLSMADRNALGIKSILGGGGPTSQKLAALLMQKPEVIKNSEFGGQTLDPLTGQLLSTQAAIPKAPNLGPMGEAQALLRTQTPGTKPYADTLAYIAKLNAPPVGTTINTGEKSLKSQLGTNVANALDTSATQAQAAAKTLGVVNNIRTALSTGKVITGPGTTARQIFLQISGNNPDALAQTRQVVQGLAQLTLNSRGLLKGQGQVSDFEGKLLEKAQSGGIDSLTGPEISTVLDVIERQGRDAIKLNKTYVQKAKTGDVFDFFNVDEPAPTSGAWTGRP